MAHQRRYPRRVTPSPVVTNVVDFTLPCFGGDVQTTYFCGDADVGGPTVQFTVTLSGWLSRGLSLPAALLKDDRPNYHSAMTERLAR